MNRSTPTHLARRAVTSFSNSEPNEVDLARVAEILSSAEFDLWQLMQGRDKRHSIEVLCRFDELCPEATTEERAAALLHDVGKSACDLGWFGRIVATLVGPRSPRLRTYLDHESIGVQMLTGVSQQRTIDLISGAAGTGSDVDSVHEMLLRADDI